MKNLFVFISFISCTISLFAQEDRFSSVDQTKGKDDTEAKMTAEEILDAAIVQKLLPKLLWTMDSPVLQKHNF